MTRDVDLDPIPSQSFSITIAPNRWDITIKECDGVMCCTLVLNEVPILSMQRMVAGSPIIPYRYLQAAGNFWILTENDELPYYDRFGVDQQLIYASPGEL